MQEFKKVTLEEIFEAIIDTKPSFITKIKNTK